MAPELVCTPVEERASQQNAETASASSSSSSSASSLSDAKLNQSNTPLATSAVSTKTDIWALACVLLEIFVGRRPWNGLNVTYIIAQLQAGNPPPELHELEAFPPVHCVLHACLQRDTRLRPDAAIVLRVVENLARALCILPESFVPAPATPSASQSSSAQTGQSASTASTTTTLHTASTTPAAPRASDSETASGDEEEDRVSHERIIEVAEDVRAKQLGLDVFLSPNTSASSSTSSPLPSSSSTSSSSSASDARASDFNLQLHSALASLHINTNTTSSSTSAPLANVSSTLTPNLDAQSVRRVAETVENALHAWQASSESSALKL